ncbi:hypothetical protein C8J56DRAFT_890445 [Mycena floridula]|nr:hypothetical protein C8J56DRAFT_890445 [Mycena floridula]
MSVILMLIVYSSSWSALTPSLSSAVNQTWRALPNLSAPVLLAVDIHTSPSIHRSVECTGDSIVLSQADGAIAISEVISASGDIVEEEGPDEDCDDVEDLTLTNTEAIEMCRKLGQFCLDKMNSKEAFTAGKWAAFDSEITKRQQCCSYFFPHIGCQFWSMIVVSLPVINVIQIVDIQNTREPKERKWKRRVSRAGGRLPSLNKLLDQILTSDYWVPWP